MTATEQQARFGISVVPSVSGQVVFNIAGHATAISPDEARRFAYELASAYFRAENLARQNIATSEEAIR